MADLSHKYAQVIPHLLQGKSHGEAATACGISVRTVDRWTQQPAFKQALAQAKQETLTAAFRALQATTMASVTTLRSIIENPEVTDSVRVRASIAVLELVVKVQQLEALEARVKQLEEYQRATDTRS